MGNSPLFEVGALLLFFFVPGFLLVKALWPEWRVRGPTGAENLLKLLAGGVILSTALSLLIGFYLGNTGLFQAGPSDPILEATLAGLSAAFAIAGWFRGAYARTPPTPAPIAGEVLPGEEDTLDYLASLGELGREERRLRHEVRVARKAGQETGSVQKQLDETIARRKGLEQERERLLRSHDSLPPEP